MSFQRTRAFEVECDGAYKETPALRPPLQFDLIVNRNIVNKVETIDPIDVAFSQN